MDEPNRFEGLVVGERQLLKKKHSDWIAEGIHESTAHNSQTGLLQVSPT